MSENAACANSDEKAIYELRTEFPGWGFWRAVKPDGSPGEWVATRRDPGAGVSATVMQPSPEALRGALLNERAEAETRGL